ncbi:HD domain-containing protein [Candidatus Micrarchaeota archaeon]|nr:HD domain-containing protein [Candidatus Micrarchaeota archaeon]
MEEKKIMNFIFELGQLKRIKHEGWRIIGVENPETVGEHALRAAQIGFILAKLENYENPFEVCSIVVFHENEECRTGDIHKVANRYVIAEKEKVVKEQVEKLEGIGKEIFELWKQAEYQNTKAGIIAKDADLLEMAVTAKEYVERGLHYAQDWINNVSKTLQTESAKALLNSLKDTDSNSWWQGLKKID